MSDKKKLNCSYDTERELAKALKELMKAKSFEKISISDITNYCSMHRQTFYYHFVDKYELLEWIVHNELILPLVNDFSLDNLYDKFMVMFDTMKSEKDFYHNALKININELFNYISNLATRQFSLLLNEVERANNIKRHSDDEIKMMSEFFGYGISGVILEWVHHGMKETPQEMVERIRIIVDAIKKLAASRI